MKTAPVIALTLALCATAALAHQGVKNPAVLARMNGMSAMADSMKTLGSMAKGQVAFDAAQARNALGDIAQQSAAAVDLFTPQEDDPKSEARAAIWDNFDNFTAQANALQAEADKLAQTVQTRADVQGALRTLGAACKSCHADYRE